MYPELSKISKSQFSFRILLLTVFTFSTLSLLNFTAFADSESDQDSDESLITLNDEDEEEVVIENNLDSIQLDYENYLILERVEYYVLELDLRVGFEEEIDRDPHSLIQDPVDSANIQDALLGIASEGTRFKHDGFRASFNYGPNGEPESMNLYQRSGKKEVIIYPDGSMTEADGSPFRGADKGLQKFFEEMLEHAPEEDDEEPAADCDPATTSCPEEEPAEEPAPCDPNTQSCPDPNCDPATTSCPEEEPEDTPVADCLDMNAENCNNGGAIPQYVASGHNIDGNNNDTPADDGSQECDYRNDNNCNNGEITVDEDPILGLDDGDQCDERVVGNNCVGEQVREANEADFRNNSIGPDPDELF